MQELPQSRLSVPSYRYGKEVSLDPTCLFCKIIEGEIPADIVFRNENVVAFNDIAPQAPTHILIIPTLHVENGAELAKASPTITAELFKVAEQLSSERGLGGYRTLFNTGAEAGQSVFHAHMHLLGGRALAWPPG
jgi:histidine triad (HIT) family protein